MTEQRTVETKPAKEAPKRRPIEPPDKKGETVWKPPVPEKKPVKK